jgi:hypothetical protein
MVVTRRTPVVPQPPPARNFVPPGAQRPPRTSLPKDTASTSNDATSSVAAASLAGPSNGNNDHRNGLVSICLLRNTKLFEPLSSSLTLFGLLLPDHIPVTIRTPRSTFLVLRLEGLIIVVCRTTALERSLRGRGGVARHAFFSFCRNAILTVLRASTKNLTSKPSSTSLPSYSSSRSPSTRSPCVRRTRTSSPRYVAA